MTLSAIFEALPTDRRRRACDALSHACLRGSLYPSRPRVLVLSEVDPPVVAPKWMGELVQLLGAEPVMQQFADREITAAMIGDWTPLQVLLMRQTDPAWLEHVIRDLLHALWPGGNR